MVGMVNHLYINYLISMVKFLNKISNRVKYMVSVSIIYLIISFIDLKYKFYPIELSGMFYIVLLTLPFIVPRLKNWVFK